MKQVSNQVIDRVYNQVSNQVMNQVSNQVRRQINEVWVSTRWVESKSGYMNELLVRYL